MLFLEDNIPLSDYKNVNLIYNESVKALKNGDYERLVAIDPINTYKKMLDEGNNTIEKVKDIKDKSDKISKKIKDGVKEFYNMSDEEIIEGKSNVFGYVRSIIELKVAFALFTPVLALVVWIVNKVIKHKINEEKRQKLVTKYKAEIEVLEDKISTEEDKEKKYQYMRVKAEYERAYVKLKEAKV